MLLLEWLLLLMEGLLLLLLLERLLLLLLLEWLLLLLLRRLLLVYSQKQLPCLHHHLHYRSDQSKRREWGYERSSYGGFSVLP
jgi:hypothetical protein